MPRRILEQRFREQVEDDVIQRVVQSAYLEAIREHKVDAVASPQVTNSASRPDAPFTFEARVEVKPKVEPKDYQGLPLTKANDGRGRRGGRAARADAPEHAPPGAGRGPRRGARPATSPPSTTRPPSTARRSPAARPRTSPWRWPPASSWSRNIAALEGAKVGETKELDYTFPADYRVEEVQGQDGALQVHLKGLKKKVVPELNDDFAKEIGERPDARGAARQGAQGPGAGAEAARRRARSARRSSRR